MTVEPAVFAANAARKSKPLPAPNSDFYEVYETLAPEDLAIVKRVRAFMETNVAPVATKYWIEDAFPFELLPAVKELGIGGLGMHGYGCAGGSLALVGFVQMEIARIDPSFATFIGVHGGLAMGSIYVNRRAIRTTDRRPTLTRVGRLFEGSLVLDLI
jgi:glutaryl-CoA dehydrogenase